MRLMTTALLAVLTLLAAGGAMMLLVGPPSRYTVACTRTGQAHCALEQERGDGTRRAVVPLATIDSAGTRFVPGRRGSFRVLLYLYAPQARFAAEFEGSDAGEDALAAAAQLNAFFARPQPADVRLDVTAPTLLRNLAWLGLGVTVLLVIAGYRVTRTG
jgi:hypothetical protein